MSRPPRGRLAAFGVACLLGASACGASPDAEVTLFDYGILAPTTMVAGERTFEITVEGVAHHTLTICPAEQLATCDGDPIPLRFTRKPADARDPGIIPDETSAIVLGAGWNAEVVGTLDPGSYRVYCSIVNHSAYGMDRLLTITPAA